MYKRGLQIQVTLGRWVWRLAWSPLWDLCFLSLIPYWRSVTAELPMALICSLKFAIVDSHYCFLWRVKLNLFISGLPCFPSPYWTAALISSRSRHFFKYLFVFMTEYILDDPLRLGTLLSFLVVFRKGVFPFLLVFRHLVDIEMYSANYQRWHSPLPWTRQH